MRRRVRLSASEARRTALAAQGLDRERPGRGADARHFRQVLQATRLLQLDFVNVLIPAHFLVMWSRLGAYDLQRFEKFLYRSGRCTEQWAHEASIVPVDAWSLLAHRRATWRPSNRNPLLTMRGGQEYLRQVLEQVRAEGAVTANDVPAAKGPSRKPGDWHRPMSRIALEYHFARGELAVAGRLPNFQRLYDLPERVIPAEHLERSWTDDDAQRELVLAAARACGVATIRDLADYYRMKAGRVAPLVDDLVDAGQLVPVTVEGWNEPSYLAADARIPRSIDVATLLSPFDPLVWYRPRAERLFDFFYRIEIYVPEHQRKWGYYVLPFLLGERLVARVDLKADRAAGTLLVRQSHTEECCDESVCASRLANELEQLAGWLGLERVAVLGSGGFVRKLRANLGHGAFAQEQRSA